MADTDDMRMDQWYRDDQFLQQLGNPGGRAVVANRLRVFGQVLQPLLAAGKPLRILDAGCGDGINLVGLQNILADHGDTHQVVGVDLNPLRVERALKHAKGAVLEASLAALPFSNGSFDVVLCNHVIEHIPDPRPAVAEIVRVLCSGGLAIIGVPNEGCAVARLRNHVLQRTILRTTDHVNFFTSDSLCNLLADSQLSVELLVTEGFFLPHMRLSNFLGSYSWGRWMLSRMGKVLPSQAAGLIAVTRRSHTYIKLPEFAS